MAMNYIWIAFFLIAAAVAVVKLVVFGDLEVFPNIINATFTSARMGFEISLGLTGVLSLWMGVMKIGEEGGVVNAFARWLSPLFKRLFPEIPEGHPVVGNIFMNLSANMLGLDNAATPLGLKAMEGLQELNPQKDRASNAMIMFMVLNTAGLTLVPVSILVYRAQMGAAQPTDVFIPILLATYISTLFGVLLTSIIQHINLLNRPIMTTLGVLCLMIAGIAYAAQCVDRSAMNVASSTIANVLLLGVIIAFIVAGMRKHINVYDAFVEGAKGGFKTAVGIIPYLIAILVGVGVFRASGAMDWLIKVLGYGLEALGLNPDITNALPTALMKPLSGSGARGMMVDCMQQFGADSFAGRLSCIFQSSTDTTFYILAVYFGAVGIKKTRYALPCGLAADFVSMVVAVVIAEIFFG